MGRLLGAVLLLACCSLPARAQRSAGGLPAMVGLFGGVNFAKFGGDDVGDVNTRTGFQAGAYASFPLGRMVAISPSLAYSQQGTKVDVGGGITGTFKLNYLELPVMLKLSAPLQGSGKVRPYVMAGPAVGFELSCSVEASTGSQSASADCNGAQLNLNTRNVVFGVHFGAGIEIDRLFFGAKYQLGLTSVDDAGDSDVKNRVIAIVAGYAVRLGH